MRDNPDREQDTDSFPAGLKICVIDDSAMICKGYSRLLLPRLKVDEARSHVVCPKTKADCEFFLDKVEGAHDGSGPADIVLLDQNIELEKDLCLGTELARDLRTRGFRGVVLVRSANTSSEDIQGYMKGGLVTACFGKNGNNNELATEIRAVYLGSSKKEK